jgi:ATP synthase I chain
VEESFYERALWRIRLLTGVVAAVGSIAMWVRDGFRPASGFLLGAALSFLNFQAVSSLAHALGGSSRPGLVATVLIALRYVLIGAALYVIISLLGYTPAAVLGGLLAAFGAVILEVLYELARRPH